MIGRHVRTHAGVVGAILRNPATRAEEAAIHKKARQLLEYVGIAGRRHELAKHLSYGDQRRLEIARALATEPRLLALDEPAAGMNAGEKMELRKLLEAIRADGITLLLIEHDVRLVMGLCDRVLVLDYGRNIAEGVPAAVQKDPRSSRRTWASRKNPPREPAFAGRLAGRLWRNSCRERDRPARGGARGGVPHRRQRRGEDHDAEGDHRARAAGGGKKFSTTATSFRGGAVHDIARRGLALVPEGAASSRSSPSRRTSRWAPTRARTARPSPRTWSALFTLFPRLKEGASRRPGRSRAANSRCSPSPRR
jgi:ABC-type branched-subunit amino acid transport system ATPase component